MGRHVKRSFISFSLRKFKMEICNHCDFCKCYYCKRFDNLHKELKRGSFHNFNKEHEKWFLILYQKHDNEITIFPVFI